MKQHVFLFFPTNGKVGGAEKRVITSFSYVAEHNSDICLEIGLLPICEIDQKRLTEFYKTITDLKIRFYKSRCEIFNYVSRNHFDWVVYTDCSYRCLPVLFGATIGGSKKLMICADTVGSSQTLPCIHQALYNFDVSLSSRIDCLYPTSTTILKKRFKKKKITCTPGSFTNLEKFFPVYPKEKKIIFLGRLMDGKGIRLFIDSVISIAQRIRDNGFVCQVYGFGPLENEIIRTVSDNHCQDVIEIMGHIENSESVLSKSSIFCSLQICGNYPSQSLLEAMACGNYCIVSDTYDSHLLVKPEFGELVDMTVTSVSNAITKAMNMSNDDYKRIADASRAFLREFHTLKKSAEYFENIIMNDW